MRSPGIDGRTEAVSSAGPWRVRGFLRIGTFDPFSARSVDFVQIRRKKTTVNGLWWLGAIHPRVRYKPPGRRPGGLDGQDPPRFPPGKIPQGLLLDCREHAPPGARSSGPEPELGVPFGEPPKTPDEDGGASLPALGVGGDPG